MSTSSALLCLALNIYHESRGEPKNGQIAVAMVTMNRAQWQPENICEVVYAHRQFSWTRSSAKPHKMEEPAWRRAKKIAKEVMLGEHNDISDGATHFHTHDIRPKWSRSFEQKMRIGRHIFYSSN